MFFSNLSNSAQTAYAEVFDQLMADSFRSVADLKGTFAKKNVSGREYWYYQYRDVDQKVKQIYLGPNSTRIEKLMATKSQQPNTRVESIGKQARAAIVLGNTGMTRSHFRIIKRMEECGYFKAGGVLIGTHAYACYGNMLGIHWRDADHTQDVDFAYAGRSIALAMPTNVEVNVHDAITSLEMGFLPATQANGLVGGSYVNPDQPDFRLDFITTVGRDQSELVNFPTLNVAMIPLQFMEYSLVDLRQVALISDEGAVLVSVPSPARYAMHKLIVAGLREGAYKVKASKDLRQSASLISFLAKYQPDDLMEAWTDLDSRGKGWRSRFEKGVGMLLREIPEIENSLIWQDKPVLDKPATFDDKLDTKKAVIKLS